MNKRTEIGGNLPPDPIDECLAAHTDVIAEAENWLDGAQVENEGQMKAVDQLTKAIKAALKDVNLAEKSVTAPMYDAWKAEKARWKPTIDDLARIRDGLIAAVAPFKKRVADAKAKAEREAWEKANAARIEAERIAKEAATSDLEAQRAAEAAKQAAMDADKAARAQAKDTVKGMRKVQRYQIEDLREALHWIAKNDKEAVTAFIEEYVRRNHKARDIDGVNQWTEKEAF